MRWTSKTLFCLNHNELSYPLAFDCGIALAYGFLVRADKPTKAHHTEPEADSIVVELRFFIT